MERDPVIVQILCCSGKVRGWARFCSFYFIKLIAIKRCRRWEIFTGAWGELLSVLSQ